MSTHRATHAGRVNAPSGVGLFLSISVFVAGFATQAGAQIRPVDLGTLGGQSSFAVALNDSGQVVGNSQVADGSYHAFLWTAADGMLDLGTLGGPESFAVAVNAGGVVVGESDTALGGRHAFLWTRKGGMIDLLGFDSGDSHALAVTASGQVIGYTGFDVGLDPFSWTSASGFTDLGTLGGFARVQAVSPSGQVVGVSSLITACPGCPDPDDEHAFSWTAKGGMIDLGTLGGFNSSAQAVDASGRVVGISETADGLFHNFSWTATGGMIDLGEVGEMAAMNDKGQIVGTRYPEEGGQFAFSWTAAGGTTVLDTFYDGSGAVAVNARGQVIGSTFSNDANEDGVADHFHGFSWTAAG